MRKMKRQKGMTAIGWVLVLLLIMVFAIVGIRLFPMYMDSFNVSTSMESLTTDPQARGKSALQIRTLLMKRLDINMVKDVSTQDITISRNRNGITLAVEYEVRRPLFGDLYLLLAFNKSVEIPK